LKYLGEYEVQTGFGWTNGVIIDFMVIFGDDLLSDEEDTELMEGKNIHSPYMKCYLFKEGF